MRPHPSRAAAGEGAPLTLKSLRALLRAWHHPARLSRHPLAHSPPVQARCAQHGEDVPTALRAVVEAAIQQLRPPTPPTAPDDPAWRGYLALTGHYLKGRSVEAIAAEMGIATVSCRRALKEALEVLAEALRRAIAPSDGLRRPVNTAPLVAGPLVGRTAALRQLEALLDAGHRRLAVHGLPGVGKSRLLAQLAHLPTVRARFPAGVLWAGLGPQPDLGAILTAWGLALGLSWHDLLQPAQPAARAGALRQLIGDQRLLFILDDVWAADGLADLLAACGPQCAVVIATRRPDLAAEFAAEPARVALAPLDAQASHDLLRRLAPQVSSLCPDDLARLAAASAGLPLTLTLIGHALRRAAHAGQGRRIRDAVTRMQRADQRLALPLTLSDLALRATAQPTTLRDVLALSVARLSAGQRRALAGLAILPPDPARFDEATALELIGAALGERGPAPTDALDALVDAGLVAHDDHGYSLHASIAELLLSDDDADAQAARGRARGALAAQVAQWLAAAEARTRLPPARWPLALAAAQAALALGAPATIAELADALGEWLLARGHGALLAELLDAAEAARIALSGAQQARLAIRRSQLLLQRGQAQAALDVLRRALAKAEALAPLYAAQARAHLHAGEMDRALAAAERGLASAEAPRDRLALLSARAAALGNLGRYGEAEAALRAALAEAERLGDTTQQIALGINLGIVCRQQRRLAEARQHLEAALHLARAVDFRDQMAHALTCLGIAAADEGDYARAEAHYGEALALAQQLASLPRIILLEHALGVVAMRQGRMEAAGAHLRQALALAEQHQLVWFTASVRIELGEWHLACGEVDRAAEIFGEARAIGEAKGYRDLAALAGYGLAQVEAARGNSAAAEALGSASLAALRALSHYRADEVAGWLARLRARPDAAAHGEDARTA